VVDKAALRFDLRDYFNSIDVTDLLARLPAPFTRGTGPGTAGQHPPRPPGRSGRAGDRRRAEGRQAGTPLAPLLGTLYLRELDAEVAGMGATYARYSDDIVVLAPPQDLAGLEHLIRCRLAERWLEVNESKSAVSQPGEPWDFLGFRYSTGSIGLAPITGRKLRARTTRLARALLRWRERTAATPDRALVAFLRRTNRRLYGTPGERGDFSWATWFLPMLDGPAGLEALDQHLQREARYVATERRTPGTRGTVPDGALTRAGHVPLVAAVWAMRQGPATSNTTSRSAPTKRTRARPSGRDASDAPSISFTGALPPGGAHSRCSGWIR